MVAEATELRAGRKPRRRRLRFGPLNAWRSSGDCLPPIATRSAASAGRQGRLDGVVAASRAVAQPGTALRVIWLARGPISRARSMLSVSTLFDEETWKIEHGI
jgi:hypothetical protein